MSNSGCGFVLGAEAVYKSFESSKSMLHIVCICMFYIPYVKIYTLYKCLRLTLVLHTCHICSMIFTNMYGANISGLDESSLLGAELGTTCDSHPNPVFLF